jgi:peptidoglycan-associated lipoprotein
MRRAEVAKRYLVDLGIDARRVTTISFGEENLVVRGHSEAAWAKNRRDDFVVR